MTATENVGFARPKSAAQKKNPGHRYQVGHPHYPRKHGGRSQAARFKRRSREILAAIIEERGGELSPTQLIHAQNAADLGASIMEMKDRKNAGEHFDQIAHATLINRQRQALESLDE
jgi:hypothetical protein